MSEKINARVREEFEAGNRLVVSLKPHPKFAPDQYPWTYAVITAIDGPIVGNPEAFRYSVILCRQPVWNILSLLNAPRDAFVTGRIYSDIIAHVSHVLDGRTAFEVIRAAL